MYSIDLYTNLCSVLQQAAARCRTEHKLVLEGRQLHSYLLEYSWHTPSRNVIRGKASNFVAFESELEAFFGERYFLAGGWNWGNARYDERGGMGASDMNGSYDLVSLLLQRP